MSYEGIIIDAPHLQSFGQRVCSIFASILCWGLWIYFLVPVISLLGWLFGVRSFSAEVRWFGGYKSLLELLQIYAMTVLVIVLVWLLWAWLSTLFNKKEMITQENSINSVFTEIDITQEKGWKALTVMFDAQGHITKTERL